MTKNETFLDRVIAAYTGGVSDMAYSDQQWPGVLATADKLMSLMEAAPPARILDLACGAGAMTVALALKGFDVTGIDCTPASLEIAKRMSSRKGASVQWLCEDMRALCYEGEFDNVCLRDVVFGIFETKAEDIDLLRRIGLALKDGGRCLLEVYNKEFALQHGVERSLFYDESVDRFIRKGPDEEGLSVRLYSHDEWERMLAGNGLRIIKMDGWNWKRDPKPPPWRADFIVAQKESGHIPRLALLG